MKENELEFTIFCIESLASYLGITPQTAYELLSISINVSCNPFGKLNNLENHIQQSLVFLNT